MSRVVIIAIGSRGDVAPLVGLGARLAAAGHDVTVAAYAVFADLVTEAGLAFRQVDEDVSVEEIADTTDPMKELLAFISPRGYREQAHQIIEAVRELPADLLAFSPLAESAGHHLAELAGIPSVGLRLQPLSRSADHPPTVLGLPSLGRIGNRAAGSLSTTTLDRLYGRSTRDLRTNLGLREVSARRLRRRRTDADWPILHGYSPLVAPRPADWRQGLEVTGYWWPPSPPGWQPPEDLARFLDAGPPPVYVGFGSMVTSPRQTAKLSATVATALGGLGVRAVVQAGWANLGADRAGTDSDGPSGAELLAASPDIMVIGEAPHEWLFPRMSAVIHHCGAGTAAGGLRAGVPAVGVPLVGDQPFWARRLRELGVSGATVPQYRLDAKRLTRAIDATLSDPAVAARAREFAPRLAAEDGAGAAVARIERLLDSSGRA